MQNLLSQNKSVEVVTKMMKNISLYSTYKSKSSTSIDSVGDYREFEDEDAMEVTYEDMDINAGQMRQYETRETKLRSSTPKIFAAFNNFEEVEYMEVDENLEGTSETSSVGYFTGAESDSENYGGYKPEDFGFSSEEEETMELDGVPIIFSKTEDSIEKDSQNANKKILVQSQNLVSVSEKSCKNNESNLNKVLVQSQNLVSVSEESRKNIESNLKKEILVQPQNLVSVDESRKNNELNLNRKILVRSKNFVAEESRKNNESNLNKKVLVRSQNCVAVADESRRNNESEEHHVKRRK